jgi:serine protease AprX
MNSQTLFKQLKRMTVLTIVFAMLASTTLAASPPKTQFGSFIVQGADLETVSQLVEANGGEVTSRLDLINGVGALLPVKSVAHLLTDPQVTSVTLNAEVKLADQQRGEHNQTPATDYPDVVGADVAWEQGSTGDGVTVAVIDTGFYLHPGLTRNTKGNPHNYLIGWADFVDQSRSPIDPNGHGTHIAGIIANSQNGSDGEWNGVAPDIQLVGVRVLDSEGKGTYENVIQGIQWVIENNEDLNVKVINLSLVSTVQSPYWADPLNQAVMQAWANGITVVVAAGNGGPGAMTIGVPGNNPYVITVGAFTDNFTPNDWSDDYLTPFSAAGPTLDGFVKPDVLAPGAHMVSTISPSGYLGRSHPENRLPKIYYWMAGTSQSAAVVSGLSALILANNPDLTPDEVKYRIMMTAFPWVDLQTEPMETVEALYSMWQQGAGRVNAPDAVFAEIDGSANYNMDIEADLAGTQHYQGFSYYDEESGEFRLHGEFYEDWTGGYGAWAGDYEPYTGGYGAWAGGYGAWAGGYGAWAGGYGAWAGGYGAWAGGYGAWAGGYGAWAGGNETWAGGYGAWAGGYGAWAGGYGAWAGSYGDAEFAERFVNWQAGYGAWAGSYPWVGNWIEFDG